VVLEVRTLPFMLEEEYAKKLIGTTRFGGKLPRSNHRNLCD